MTENDGPIYAIRTSQASLPAGHYAQGMCYGSLVFVSGQLPVRPDGSHAPQAPLESQVRQALENVLAIIREAGCEAKDLLKVTAYLVGVECWPAFDRVYAEALGENRPARAVVPVPALHYGYLVEIEAIAARRRTRGST